MSAYRAPVDMPVVVLPQGLVRANGSQCRCVPPSFLWCWWYGVQENDTWFCIHGGGWRRDRDYGSIIIGRFRWKAWRGTDSDQEKKR